MDRQTVPTVHQPTFINQFLEEAMETLVREIMTESVISLEEWENLLDVAKDMERFHLRHLPVVDGHKLVGLISHRDLLRFSVSRLDPSPVGDERDENNKRNTFVADVMTRNVEVVRPDDSVAHAARKLIVGRFGCLPVVDDQEQLVGIVTELDLLHLIADGPPPREMKEMKTASA